MTPLDPLLLAAEIAALIERAGLRYVIGGSVAASLAGEPRSTLDIDIMIERDAEKTRHLARLLRDSAYVDEESAIAAARESRSFNAIHFATSMKIDFFVAEQSRFATEALAHRRLVEVAPGRALYFYAIEDLIVRKLLWYRMGNEVSERQWRDVLGMLRINLAKLDVARMTSCAVDAGVSDLLRKTLAEAAS